MRSQHDIETRSTPTTIETKKRKNIKNNQPWLARAWGEPALLELFVHSHVMSRNYQYRIWLFLCTRRLFVKLISSFSFLFLWRGYGTDSTHSLPSACASLAKWWGGSTFFYFFRLFILAFISLFHLAIFRYITFSRMSCGSRMGVEVIGCTIMSACFRCMYRFLSTKLSALLLSIVHLLFCLLLSIVLGRYFPPLSPFPNPIASYLNIPISLSARALFYSPQHT